MDIHLVMHCEQFDLDIHKIEFVSAQWTLKDLRRIIDIGHVVTINKYGAENSLSIIQNAKDKLQIKIWNTK